MRTLVLLVALAFSSLAAGCTLIVDDKVDGITLNATPDMNLHLIGMDPHIGQLTEIYLVNDASLVQAVAIYDPLPEVDVDVQLENVVAADVKRIDFYCDLNENGQLDAPMRDEIDPTRRLFPDHMWRLYLAFDMPPDQDGEASFRHNTNFTDITQTDSMGVTPASFLGGPVTLTLTGVGDFADQHATISVRGPNDREVGFYFLQTIGGDTLNVDFKGRHFVDSDTMYTLEITLGDDPRAEPVCISQMATEMDGLAVEASLSTLEPCPQ